MKLSKRRICLQAAVRTDIGLGLICLVSLGFAEAVLAMNVFAHMSYVFKCSLAYYVL